MQWQKVKLGWGEGSWLAKALRWQHLGRDGTGGRHSHPEAPRLQGPARLHRAEISLRGVAETTLGAGWHAATTVGATRPG